MWTPVNTFLLMRGASHSREELVSNVTTLPNLRNITVVDSSNNYCLKVDIYVCNAYEDKRTEFGVTHDLVICMLDGFLQKSYIVYMDNYYTSHFLFYNLRLAQTGAVGTSRPRRGFIPGFLKTKLKKKGDRRVMTYNNGTVNRMMVMKIFDRKPVSLLSTVYCCQQCTTQKMSLLAKCIGRLE